jgi:L-ascorbate metabolism protein UlaG (beta-lactamase superfamily)
MFTILLGSILIDPFLQGNPVNRVPLEDINPDVVVITHGHGDHFGNAVELEAKGAHLISSVEVEVPVKYTVLCSTSIWFD